MPIFSRRAIQNLLDSVAPHSTVQKISQQIKKIERGGQDAISTAWELAVTAALTGQGNVRVEPDLGTSRRVDFELSLADPLWHGIGDIVTVFDDGMHDRSGLSKLESLIWTRVRAHRLPRTRFNIWLQGDIEGTVQRRRRVMLPAYRPADITRRLDAFLKTVTKNTTLNAELNLIRDFGFALRYDPKQYSGTWSGTRIDSVYGIDANPLMNALKRKASQLRDTCFTGPRIIVCCDGGSQSIRAQRNAVWRTPNNQDIVEEFLRQNTSVAGVALIIVNQSPLRPVIRSAERELYLIPVATGPRASSLDGKALDRIAAHLEATLPRVIRSPSSFPEPWEFKPDYQFFRFVGFSQMSSSFIRLPMRALLNLMAGTLSQKEFIERYVDAPGTGVDPNIFARWSRSGRVITETRIIPDPDHDDDWVEFKVGPPDPALSAFRNPLLSPKALNE